MKPLKHCPHCHAELEILDRNISLFETICQDRCKVSYHQHLKYGFGDEEIWYFSFYTPNNLFNVYSYYQDHLWPFTTHVYSVAIMNKKGTSRPILALKNFTMDLNNLTKLEEKFSTYALFI